MTGDQIPLQSKIMTISDIYDALTAADRPYKKATTVEQALDILDYERKAGNIDGTLLALFVEAKVYERTRPRAEPTLVRPLAGQQQEHAAPRDEAQQRRSRTRQFVHALPALHLLSGPGQKK